MSILADLFNKNAQRFDKAVEQSRNENLYERLGVEKGADTDRIRAAGAILIHTLDAINQLDGSDRKDKAVDASGKILEAIEILTDPVRREGYDRSLDSRSADNSISKAVLRQVEQPNDPMERVLEEARNRELKQRDPAAVLVQAIELLSELSLNSVKSALNSISLVKKAFDEAKLQPSVTEREIKSSQFLTKALSDLITREADAIQFIPKFDMLPDKLKYLSQLKTEVGLDLPPDALDNMSKAVLVRVKGVLDFFNTMTELGGVNPEYDPTQLNEILKYADAMGLDVREKIEKEPKYGDVLKQVIDR